MGAVVYRIDGFGGEGWGCIPFETCRLEQALSRRRRREDMVVGGDVGSRRAVLESMGDVWL
jgi:hypothetical protein